MSLNVFSPALLLSLKVASLAVGLNLTVGIPVGFYLARKKFFGKELLDTTLTLPMVLPPTVLGYYLLTLLGRDSAFGRWLQDSLGLHLVFTCQAAVIAASIASFPLILKPVRSSFEMLDPRYEEAAIILGLSKLSIFFRVSFPLTLPGIMAGAALAFARSLGEFGATLMVAGNIPGKTQTLSLAIYQAVQAGDSRATNAAVALISVICTILLIASKYLSRRLCHQL